MIDVRRWFVYGSLCLSFVTSAQQSSETAQAAQDVTVRLNQLQVIGTHNSYHAGFAPSEAKLMRVKDPKAFAALDYSHRPLG